MNVSPLDIRKHEFKKSLRGFDPDEVMAFLDMISVEFENLVRETSALKERSERVDAQLKKYHDIENTLRETLLSAQRAREETINTAKKHADVIIREAEVKAASIIETGRRDLSQLKSEYTQLKLKKENYVVKIRSMVKTQLEMLENVDFSDEESLVVSQKAEEPFIRQTPELSVSDNVSGASGIGEQENPLEAADDQEEQTLL